MDKRSGPLKQVKERESKIFNQKAENFSKELKEMTAVPLIDPLSRKIAKLITRKELASLGIQSAETPTKHPFINLDSQINLKNSKKKDQDRHENKPDEPEPAPGYFSGCKKPNTQSYSQSSKTSQISGEKTESKNIEKDERVNNIEHLQALQKETQNESPELDPKYVHKNDLNEPLTERNTLTPVNSPKDLLEVASPGSDLRITEASPTTERLKIEVSEQEKSPDSNTLKKSRLSKQDSPSKIEHIPQRSSLTDKKNAELFEICSTLLKGKTEATSVTCKTPDFLKKQNLKQQEYATKAEFLHYNNKPVGQFTPRCHINLNSSKSSPIFFSFRVLKGSKMKAEQGLASVDSLRVLLLRSFLGPEPVEKDVYTKNLEWVQGIQEKLEKIREENEGKDIEGCTFDPFFEKHEALRVDEEPFVYKAVLRNDLGKEKKEFVPVIPEEVVKYEALSPVCYQVRYAQGFNLKRVEENGRVLIGYQGINQFK